MLAKRDLKVDDGLSLSSAQGGGRTLSLARLAKLPQGGPRWDEADADESDELLRV